MLFVRMQYYLLYCYMFVYMNELYWTVLIEYLAKKLGYCFFINYDY